MQLIRMKSAKQRILVTVRSRQSPLQSQVLPPTLWIAFAIYFPLGFINVLHLDFWM